DNAYGVVFAFGGRACALFAVGGLAVGLIAMGGIALGAVAMGGLAGGCFAFGGLPVGWQAWGGLALASEIACGGFAAGWHAAYGGIAVANDYAVGGAAWAEHANDDAAKAALLAHPATAIFDWYVANAAWMIPLLVLGFLVFCGAMVRIMYRREPERGN